MPVTTSAPSSPELFSPQQIELPEEKTAHACVAPTEISAIPSACIEAVKEMKLREDMSVAAAP